VTALLQAMETPLRGKDQEYGPPYGFTSHANPYRGSNAAFSHATMFGGSQIYLATMLSGYWSDDAIGLIARSVASDLSPPSAVPGATFVLEDGSGAANVRDADFPQAVANLAAAGHPAVHVLGSDPEVTRTVIASHVTAGVYSGNSQSQIASNTYPPGALVDVLESFGLTPGNFTPGGVDQVPVTWWVQAGITGAHGTVAEPYNVAFPDGFMLEPYVAGFNLAETFYQGIPFLYWMNLVLGDPLAQPYAVPPRATVVFPADGAVVSGPVRLAGSATTPAPEGIRNVRLFADDALLATIGAPSGQVIWDSTRVSDGWHRLEVLATDASRVEVQGRAFVDVDVSNRGLWATITSPAPGTRVGGGVRVDVGASLLVGFVRVEAEGQVVGSGPGGGGRFPIFADTTPLPRGPHRLVAIGTTGFGEEVRSRPVDIVVVKAPRFDALAPSQGPQGGGTPVAVTGWAFEPDIDVFFGPNRAAGVVRTDANHLVATTPRGAPGPVDVRLVNPFGQELTLPGAFTYQPETCADPTDTDADGTCDANDSCPLVANPAQEDLDADGVGDACECAATQPASDLRAWRVLDRLALAWQPPAADPCRAGDRVFTTTSPLRGLAFPADWTDVTALDEDPAEGAWRAPLPPGALVFVLVASEGNDGSIGPR
jgi:hypothetical protein